jgi:hypothetical protein
MSGITLTQAQAQLDALLSCQSTNALSYTVNGRSTTFRSLEDLLKAITFWNDMVVRLTRVNAGGKRISYAVAKLDQRR